MLNGETFPGSLNESKANGSRCSMPVSEGTYESWSLLNENNYIYIYRAKKVRMSRGVREERR